MADGWIEEERARVQGRLDTLQERDSGSSEDASAVSPSEEGRGSLGRRVRESFRNRDTRQAALNNLTGKAKKAGRTAISTAEGQEGLARAGRKLKGENLAQPLTSGGIAEWRKRIYGG